MFLQRKYLNKKNKNEMVIKRAPYKKAYYSSNVLQKSNKNTLNNRKALVKQVRNKIYVNPAIKKFTKRAGMGEEVKTLDLNFTGAYNATYTQDVQPQQILNLNTGTGSVQMLNLIQQGAGIAQRIGHKVSLQSLRIRMNIVANGVFNAQPTNGRIMILYDHNPDGSYVASNSILGNSIQSNSITTGLYSDNLNPNYFERMVVLMDKFISLPPYTNGSLSTSDTTGCTEICSFHIDEFIKLKDLESIYGNTSNGAATANPMTIAYIQTGAIYILTYGDTAAASAPWCLTGNCRLRFKDN